MNRYFAWFGLKGSLVLTSLMSGFALALAMLFPSGVRFLCLAAMLLSSGGDIFLMHSEAIERRFPNYFTIGAALFMLAHLMYTACFQLKLRRLNAPAFGGAALAVMAVAVICLVVYSRLCICAGNQALLPLAVVYLAVISLNCMTVLSYAQAAATLPAIAAAVGAVSFLVSDLVIGLGRLGNIHRYDFLIWWLYPIGQILLIAGVGR